MQIDLESPTGDLKLKFKLQGKVREWAINQVAIIDNDLFVLTTTNDQKTYFCTCNLEDDEVKESEENCTMFYVLNTKNVLVKCYKDNQVEFEDQDVLFYPFAQDSDQ